MTLVSTWPRSPAKDCMESRRHRSTMARAILLPTAYCSGLAYHITTAVPPKGRGRWRQTRRRVP